MERKFEQILKDCGLLDATKHILLAISGGVDSIVLFHLLQSIEEDKRPKVSVAHVNHQLRTGTKEEERFVKNLSEEYHCPFYSYTWTQENHPESGIEEAAREMRYAFFEEVMEAQGIDVLMTGHHQDDQVETILMKLTRGSSLEQLTGIQMSRKFYQGLLVRPLLSFPKQALYRYAQRNAIKYVEDETNQELLYSRNRFRNQIIPLMQEENTQFNRHMEQFSKDLVDLIDIATPAINQTFQQLVSTDKSSMSLNMIEFFELEEAMQRAILQKILETLYEDSKESYKITYIELIREWLDEGDVNTQLDLSGDFLVRRAYNNVVFSKKDREPFDQTETFLIEEVNQWVKISSTEAIGLFEYAGEDLTNHSLVTDASIELPLTIRHREPGDRMTYAGLNGRKKIKDIFIDEKVPLEERDKAWLMEDAEGQIIWLLGFRKMRLLSAAETDKLTYIVKYKKLNNE